MGQRRVVRAHILLALFNVGGPGAHRLLHEDRIFNGGVVKRSLRLQQLLCSVLLLAGGRRRLVLSARHFLRFRFDTVPEVVDPALVFRLGGGGGAGGAGGAANVSDREPVCEGRCTGGITCFSSIASVSGCAISNSSRACRTWGDKNGMMEVGVDEQEMRSDVVGLSPPAPTSLCSFSSAAAFVLCRGNRRQRSTSEEGVASSARDEPNTSRVAPFENSALKWLSALSLFNTSSFT
jgi:hypothetical protein